MFVYFCLFELVFDVLLDVVFFVKDVSGCYVIVNCMLVMCCGYKDKCDLFGKMVDEVFLCCFGCSYFE